MEVIQINNGPDCPLCPDSQILLEIGKKDWTGGFVMRIVTLNTNKVV